MRGAVESYKGEAVSSGGSERNDLPTLANCAKRSRVLEDTREGAAVVKIRNDGCFSQGIYFRSTLSLPKTKMPSTIPYAFMEAKPEEDPGR